MDINKATGIGVPPKSLEQLSVEACEAEIRDSLKKYNCAVDFVQMFVNGMPAAQGMLKVVKIKEKGDSQLVQAS